MEGETSSPVGYAPMTGPSYLRMPPRSRAPWKWLAVLCSCIIALVFVVLFAIYLTEDRGGEGGGGDNGGGGHQEGKKCSSYRQFNLTQGLSPDSSLSPPPPPSFPANQTYVHVVFMDRFAAGLTNLTIHVLDEYFRYHLPYAIYIAQMIRHINSNLQYTLTVNLYLLSIYLNCPTQQPHFYCPNQVERQEMVNAIAAGYITFTAFPLNVELALLNKDMITSALEWGRQLANETHRVGGAPTTMTIEGTQGINRIAVPLLNQSHVKAILLTTDGSVKRLGVPSVFHWQDTSSNTTILHLYQHGFPSPPNTGFHQNSLTVPTFNHILHIDYSHSVNNHSYSAHTIFAYLKSIQQQYPHATVLCSTLDNYVNELYNQSVLLGRVELPIITAEIASTSVVAITADPFKHTAFLNLQHLRSQCMNDSRCNNCSKEFFEFTALLLKGADVIQGGKVSLFLHALQSSSQEQRLYDRWNNTDFHAVQYSSKEYAQLAVSWLENRAWAVHGSLAILGTNHSLVQNYQALLTNNTIKPPPNQPDTSGLTLSTLAAGYDTGSYLISFSTAGAIVSLVDKETRRNYAGSLWPLGQFFYQYLIEKTYNQSFLQEYLTCSLNKTQTPVNNNNNTCPAYVLYEYSKVGLDRYAPPPSPPSSLPNLTLYTLHQFYVEANTQQPTKFLMALTLTTNTSILHSEFGAPSTVWIRVLVMDHRIEFVVSLYDKTATRRPEASWMTFHPRPVDFYIKKAGHKWQPGQPQPQLIQIEQAGMWIDTSEAVVSNSTDRWFLSQHVRVEQGWSLDSHDSALMRIDDSLTPLPTPLTNGAKRAADAAIYVNLHSNSWSHNGAAQWYPYQSQGDSDLQYRFTMHLA